MHSQSAMIMSMFELIHMSLLQLLKMSSLAILYAKCIASQGKSQFIEQPSQQEHQQNTKDNHIDQKLINSTHISVIFFCLFLTVCCIFFSIYLTFYSSQLKYNNQSYTINTQRSVMKYYQSTINLGISMTYVDLRDHYNYTALFMKGLGLINKSLLLQATNQKLKLFNKGKYNITTIIPGVYDADSNFEMIGVLSSGAVQYEKFDKDTVRRSAVIHTMRDIFGTLLLISIDDYRTSFFGVISPFADQQSFYDNLSIGLLSSFIVVFIVLAVLLFRHLDKAQGQALSLRRGTAFSQRKIEEIKEYLKVITFQAVPFDQINREIYNYDLTNKVETQSIFMRSQMSLVKENTGRKLNSQSQVFEEALANRLQPEQTKIMTKTGSYRWIIIISVAIGAIMAGLTATNFIMNSKLSNIDELESTSSIDSIFRASYQYSRIFVVSLNTILLKQTRGINNYAFYKNQSQALSSFFATYSYPDLAETSLDQFQPFNSKYSQLMYNPICTFMACQTASKAELNTNYLTLIRYLIPSLTQLVNQTFGMTESVFSSYILSSSIRHYLDLLFESERLLRTNIATRCILYLSNYGDYRDNMMNSKMGFIISMSVVALLALIFYIHLVIYVKIEQKLLTKIVRMYYNTKKL